MNDAPEATNSTKVYSKTTVSAVSPDRIEETLAEPLAKGYRPSLPTAGWWDCDGKRPFYQQFMQDVESMLAHPAIKIPLARYRSGISNMKVEFEASSPEVKSFVESEWQHFFQTSRPQVQRSYDYGRVGAETFFERSGGYLRYEKMDDFFPLDTGVLTHNQQYWGIRVRNAMSMAGSVADLWGPGHSPIGSVDVPPKAFFFAHNPRYNKWYGRPQCYEAWRPWRRLAGRDGAEDVTDLAFYRAYPGPEIRFPLEDYTRKGEASAVRQPGSSPDRWAKS